MKEPEKKSVISAGWDEEVFTDDGTVLTDDGQTVCGDDSPVRERVICDEGGDRALVESMKQTLIDLFGEDFIREHARHKDGGEEPDDSGEEDADK